jgi:large subunit ribosomal protein L10
MPTEKKRKQVEDLIQHLHRFRIAVATNPTGLSVSAINELRRQLRERGIDYKVVKNRLALIAADQSEKPEFKALLDGPTAIAFGYDEEVQDVAKVLSEYIKTTRAPLQLRGGVLDGQVLTPHQIQVLASLPSKNELIAKFLGQLQSPITGLVNILSSPMRGLATALQRRVEQVQNRSN